MSTHSKGHQSEQSEEEPEKDWYIERMFHVQKIGGRQDNGRGK